MVLFLEIFNSVLICLVGLHEIPQSILGIDFSGQTALHSQHSLEIVSQVGGQDVVPQQHDAAVVVLPGQRVQDVAPLRVEEAHGLRQVVPLHHAALAGVQRRQRRLLDEQYVR